MNGGFSLGAAEIDTEFERGLAQARTLGLAAIFTAGLVAFTSVLSALGIAAFLNDLWPTALIGTYEWHGLDILVLTDLTVLILSWFAVGSWIYRAHANFDLIDGPAKTFTPGWSVGWFAIPFANFVMPFKAMKELWQASHAMPVDSEQTAPGLLWLWWLSWLGGSVAQYGDYYGWLDIVGYAATSVSAACLIVIVHRINRAQPSMSIASTFE